MADFTPKKLTSESGSAKGRNMIKVPGEDTQSPPRLYLEAHHLAKLGITKMPAVGSKIKISGLAHVGSTSEDQDHADGGKPHRRMTLHLHKMDIGTDAQSSDAKEQSQKDGMKSAIDKALTKDAGSAAAKGKKPGNTPAPRGGGDSGD